MGEHELRVGLVRFYPMYMLVFFMFFRCKDYSVNNWILSGNKYIQR